MKNDNLQNLIIGAAGAEHVMENNGNPGHNSGKTRYQYLEGVARDREGNEVEVNADAFVSPYAYKFPVRMDDKIVTWDQVQDLDPMLRMTKGLIMIKYVPKNSTDRKKGRPWKIGQDLIRWDIRVSGPREWHALCKRIPELGWLERNSTLCDEMFDIAAQHPGMTFWCNVDWVRYIHKLNAQANTVLQSPLISSKVSVKEYRDKYKQKDKAVMIRYFNDVLKEINEVEALPEIIQEMKDTTGETFSRAWKDLERDPVTGQYMKKNKDKE